MGTKTAFMACIAIALLINGPTLAQTATPTPEEHPSTGICGTSIMSTVDQVRAAENTARLNPELHLRALEMQRGGRPNLQKVSQGTEWLFWVWNRTTTRYEQRMAVLVYEGPNANVWVDSADMNKSTHQPTSTIMKALFRGLDSAVTYTTPGITPRDANKGILQNDIDVFGPVPPDPEWEDKTNFYLLDIQDAVQGQNIMGYFTQHDQTTESYSNQMNLLYVDSKEGFRNPSTLLNTIAHEYQHLIHFGRHPETSIDPSERDIIFNEGCSEVASILNGYWDRQNTGYLLNTNVSFFDWHPNEAALLPDYERAMTFIHFLKERYGEQFLHLLVGTPGRSMERLDAALSSIGAGTDHLGVLKGFAIANQVRTAQPGGYQFLLNKTNYAPRPHVLIKGTPSDTVEAIDLQPYGIAYAQYRNPGGMLIRFSGPSDVFVLMMGVKDGQYDLAELNMNQEYRFPLWEGARGDTVTFALVSGAPAMRAVSWTARSVPSSVEEERAVLAPLAIDAISTPGRECRVRYTTALSDPLRLELYDVTGRLIATERVSTPRLGQSELTMGAEPLPPGAYVLRIAQGSTSVTRFLTVTD